MISFNAKIIEIKLLATVPIIKHNFTFALNFFMNKYYFFFLSLFLCLSCDGDIITTELDFEDSFDSCGDIVFYKTRENPAESLSIQITNPAITIDDLLEVDESGYLKLLEQLMESNTF